VGQYSGTPGQTVAFRSRARDYAGNLEDWSATNAADALTTLYTWQISGTVQDIRGYRVPSATLNFAPKSVVPITSSQQGTFEGYLTGWSQHTITATRPGYASSPDYRRVIETDRSIGVQVLSPLDNQIAQSGFEGGSLNSWQAGGDTAYVGVTSDTSNSGLAAAQLGQPAAFLYAVPDELDAGQLLDLASDARQYTYLFSQIVVTPAYQLRVMIKPITDTWPITSSVLLTATEPFLAVSFAPDRLGGLHVLSVVSGTTAVTHCYLPPHGPLCASPEIALPAVGLDRSMPQIAVDVSNTLHLVWVDDTVTRTLRYAQRPDGGAWSAPEAILDNASTAYLGVDDSRTVHVISSNKNNQGAGSALLFRKTMGARWSAAEAAGDTYHGLQYRFAVTGDGTEHVVWYDSGSGLHYQMKHPGQPWSDFLAISDVQEYSTTPTYLGVSAGGVVHVVYRGCMWGECIAYKVKPPASATFFHPADNFAVYNAGRAVTLDALGVIHLAWQPASDPIIHHTQTLVANGPSEYSVSQRVTIPAQAHRATVSLVEHSEPTWQLGNNRLAIEFSTGLTSTTVLSTATGSIEWSSHWADVNAWAGETITVSVVVHQAAGSPYQQAFVDDVMLGSWLTPVLTDLSQTQWDAWSPQTITLTGYNFISMPMVYLGNTVITDVDYLDEATLVAHLPAQPPGPLSMQVVNPGSQSSLPRLARVGLQTYLPVINK